jgi:transposase
VTNYEWLRQQIECLKRHPTDECVEWPFATKGGDQEYGQVALPNYGGPVSVHRIAYELYHGHSPYQCVLHRCNNPRCFNPSHLYDGNHLQNAMDRIEANSNGVKLNNDKIDHIVELLADSDLTMEEIANSFGVSANYVTFINTGRRWAHRTGGKLIRKHGKYYKLNENEVKEIISLIAGERHALTEIAQMFGVSLSTISRIRSGERWKHLVRPWEDPS